MIVTIGDSVGRSIMKSIQPSLDTNYYSGVVKTTHEQKRQLENFCPLGIPVSKDDIQSKNEYEKRLDLF